METRNTKQKDIILSIISEKENMIHPNINEITELVLKKESTIGQATIYRNINKLVSEGKLKKISSSNGFRYDINTDLHGHLVCQKCGNIIDLHDENYQKIIQHLEDNYNIEIKNTNIVFDGICSKCKEK